VVSFISIGGSWKPASAVSGSNSISNEEEDTCTSRMRRRIHACHMRRRIHACHMRRRIHACGKRQQQRR
jgi:hypothetical protein